MRRSAGQYRREVSTLDAESSVVFAKGPTTRLCATADCDGTALRHGRAKNYILCSAL